MTSPQPAAGAHRSDIGRPPARPAPDRHIVLGVSHPSDDPALHRVFEVRASCDVATGAWLARVGEQNLNEQREPWGPHLTDEAAPQAFPTAAACLGHAVATIVAMVDREADSPDAVSRQPNDDA